MTTNVRPNETLYASHSSLKPALLSALIRTAPAILMLVLTAATIWNRPLLPIDETRYFSVAWEMHERGDLLVPHLNGDPYSHKPPLLFWLINAVWSMTGVSELPARLVAPIAGVVCLVLTRLLARELWPDDRSTRDFAPLILCSMLLWMVFSTTTMFDTLVTVCSLAALLGIVRSANDRLISSWLLMTVPVGLGVLAKGPVILIHCLPAALFIGCSRTTVSSGRLRWFTELAISLAVAVAIALAWAFPAALSGGDQFANELLFGQTAGRMVNSFAHRQPFWWYLAMTPVCVCPWILCGGVWRGLLIAPRDRGLRLLLVQAGSAFVILSAISGKQVYYLMPLLPLCALVFARGLSHAGGMTNLDQSLIIVGTIIMGLVAVSLPWLDQLLLPGLAGAVSPYLSVPLVLCGLILIWPRCVSTTTGVARIATAAIAFLVVTHIGLGQGFWAGFDLRPFATAAASTARPLAWFGNYHGQLNFTGRIPRVKELFTESELRSWLEDNPDGRLVVRLPDSRSSLIDTEAVAQDTNTLHLNDSRHPAWDSHMPCQSCRPHVEFSTTIRTGLPTSTLCLVRFDRPVESLEFR